MDIDNIKTDEYIDIWMNEEEATNEECLPIPAFIYPFQSPYNDISVLRNKTLENNKEMLAVKKETVLTEGRAKRTKETLEAKSKYDSQ